MNKNLNFVNLLNQPSYGKNGIILIAHSSDIDNFTYNLVKSICLKKNIIMLSKKNSVLKKLFNNNNKFKFLINGPTTIFMSNDIENFKIFKNNEVLKNTFLPMVFYLNKRYHYSSQMSYNNKNIQKKIISIIHYKKTSVSNMLNLNATKIIKILNNRKYGN